MTPKDTYEEHQKRMRKLLSPTITGSLVQRFRDLAKRRLPKAR